MLLTDDEQNELLDKAPECLQTISKDVIQYIRDMIDQKISTGRISAKVIAKVHEELAHKEAWQDRKIDEHDRHLNELIRSFSHVAGYVRKVTGKE